MFGEWKEDGGEERRGGVEMKGKGRAVRMGAREQREGEAAHRGELGVQKAGATAVTDEYIDPDLL